MRATFFRRVTCICVVVGTLTLAGDAGQLRTVTDGVYSGDQAARGGQVYKTQCVTCHGGALEGVVGPPLAGTGFLSAWSARSLADLVDKIENTMPPQQAAMSRRQATDLAAYILQVGQFRAGQAELGPLALGQIVFPAARTPAGAPDARGLSVPATANLAQLMRGVTFPNANILFNVQVRDPGTEKPSPPVPFDFVLWGSTMYYGWQTVDQAALALIETTPLFLLPGRRCENGKPVPVDRANWKQYTAALIDAGRAAYRASQSRSVDAMVKIADQLNETCANCHQVYRDTGKEGDPAGAARCQ